MKKSIAVLTAIAVFGLVGVQAATAGRGFGGNGFCNGDCQSGEYTSEDFQKREQFRTDTTELRRQLFEKRGEYAQILDQENPDKDAAAQLWSEIFDLESQLRQQADAAGIENFGKGQGRGRGGCNGPFSGRSRTGGQLPQ
ncbi:MAG: periplasmic heavy metal sensor [Proteobacteria bacterium]|nr:periplasmic heavy metal sensor [Pseudomonadota bacterium]MBU1686835.1 periplasmic heavy metal sensor [Pseudomonadota bacterium]